MRHERDPSRRLSWNTGHPAAATRVIAWTVSLGGSTLACAEGAPIDDELTFVQPQSPDALADILEGVGTDGNLAPESVESSGVEQSDDDSGGRQPDVAEAVPGAEDANGGQPLPVELSDPEPEVDSDGEPRTPDSSASEVEPALDDRDEDAPEVVDPGDAPSGGAPPAVPELVPVGDPPGSTDPPGSVEPEPEPGATADDEPAPDAANLIDNFDFELGIEGWSASFGGAIESSAELARGGQRSARVSGRTESWQGAVIDVSSLVEPGQSYRASAFALADTSTAADLLLTARFRCGGSEQFVTVAASTGTSQSWIQLAGVMSVPPIAECSLDDVLLYVEGPPALIDLYVDDVELSSLE